MPPPSSVSKSKPSEQASEQQTTWLLNLLFDPGSGGNSSSEMSGSFYHNIPEIRTFYILFCFQIFAQMTRRILRELFGTKKCNLSEGVNWL
jgi:hypothetical protein